MSLMLIRIWNVQCKYTKIVCFYYVTRIELASHLWMVNFVWSRMMIKGRHQYPNLAFIDRSDTVLSRTSSLDIGLANDYDMRLFIANNIAIVKRVHSQQKTNPLFKHTQIVSCFATVSSKTPNDRLSRSADIINKKMCTKDISKMKQQSDKKNDREVKWVKH